MRVSVAGATGAIGPVGHAPRGARLRAPVPQLRADLAAPRHLEDAVPGAARTEGIVPRYGWLYGAGTSLARDAPELDMIRARTMPVVGGGAVWSFVHVAGAAEWLPGWRPASPGRREGCEAA